MLLPKVEKYLTLTRTPPARFGRECLGDPCFVFELRAGREPRPNTAGRVLMFIDAQKGPNDER